MSTEAAAAKSKALWTAWLRRYRARVAADAPAAADDVGAWAKSRAAAMNRVNPRIVLRNYIAQKAIDKATAGDYRAVHALQLQLMAPYDAAPAAAEAAEASAAAEAGAGAGAGADADSSAVDAHTAAGSPLPTCSVDVKPPKWAATMKVS